MAQPERKEFWGFVGRFTLLHVVTYAVFGILFFNFLHYTEHFASPQMAPLMRPTSSLWVKSAILFQIGRGALLAAVFFPFRRFILESRYGWLKLWLTLFILTGIGAATSGPGSIEGLVYTRLPLKYHLLCLPEVFLQMLMFAWLFARFEAKAAIKRTQSAVKQPAV